MVNVNATMLLTLSLVSTSETQMDQHNAPPADETSNSGDVQEPVEGFGSTIQERWMVMLEPFWVYPSSMSQTCKWQQIHK